MKTAVFLYKGNHALDAGFGVAYRYGVDHSGFSLRGEIEYQTARNQRERQLMQMYNQQGITENYPQYAANDKANTASNAVYGKNEEKKPYIFSKEMRALLGYKESKNDYKAYNSSGGGIGALGMYQIRKGGLIDAGYLTKDNKWTGKSGSKSIEDFLNNPKVQENAFDEYMKVQYRYLSHFGETKYVGAEFKGVTSNFKVTDTGLLAAIHRTGIDYMNKFFKNLEKDKDGMYYMDYSKIQNTDLKTKFLWIETRLREFEE